MEQVLCIRSTHPEESMPSIKNLCVVEGHVYTPVWRGPVGANIRIIDASTGKVHENDYYMFLETGHACHHVSNFTEISFIEDEVEEEEVTISND